MRTVSCSRTLFEGVPTLADIDTRFYYLCIIISCVKLVNKRLYFTDCFFLFCFSAVLIYWWTEQDFFFPYFSFFEMLHLYDCASTLTVCSRLPFIIWSLMSEFSPSLYEDNTFCFNMYFNRSVKTQFKDAFKEDFYSRSSFIYSSNEKRKKKDLCMVWDINVSGKPLPVYVCDTFL